MVDRLPGGVTFTGSAWVDQRGNFVSGGTQTYDSLYAFFSSSGSPSSQQPGSAGTPYLSPTGSVGQQASINVTPSSGHIEYVTAGMGSTDMGPGASPTLYPIFFSPSGVISRGPDLPLGQQSLSVQQYTQMQNQQQNTVQLLPGVFGDLSTIQKIQQPPAIQNQTKDNQPFNPLGIVGIGIANAQLTQQQSAISFARPSPNTGGADFTPKIVSGYVGMTPTYSDLNSILYAPQPKTELPGTTTVYTPEGNYLTKEIANAKVGVSPLGEVGIYQLLPKTVEGEQRTLPTPYDITFTDVYGKRQTIKAGTPEPFVLIGGGGRNAAASGAFALTSMSPVAIEQATGKYIIPQYISPGVVSNEFTQRAAIAAHESGLKYYDIPLSRLGSEAYGGIVTTLDNRTLGNITYESFRYPSAQGNLADLVDRQMVNVSKYAYAGANIPYASPENTNAIFSLSPITGIDYTNRRAEVGSQIDTSSGFSAATAPRPVYPTEYLETSKNYYSGQSSSPSGRERPVTYFDTSAKGLAAISGSNAYPEPSSVKYVPPTQIAAYNGVTRVEKGVEVPGAPGVYFTGTVERAPPTIIGVLPSTALPVLSPIDAFEESLSKPAYSAFGSLFGVSGEQAKQAVSDSARINEQLARVAPAPFLVGAVGQSTFKESLDKPAEAAINVGIGVGFGAGAKIIEGAYGASKALAAERIISSGGFARGAVQYGDFVMSAAPKVLAGVYGVSVAERSTSGFTDFNPSSIAVKAAPIAVFETVPMGVGFGIGSRVISGVVPSYTTSVEKIAGSTLSKSDINIVEGGRLITPIEAPTYVKMSPVGYEIPFREMIIYDAKTGDIITPATESVKLEIPSALNIRYSAALSTDISSPVGGENPNIPVIDLRENIAIVGGKSGPTYIPTVIGEVGKPSDVLKVTLPSTKFGVVEQSRYAINYAKTEAEMAFPRAALFTDYAITRTVPSAIRTMAGIPEPQANSRMSKPFELFSEDRQIPSARPYTASQILEQSRIISASKEIPRYSNAMFVVSRGESKEASQVAVLSSELESRFDLNSISESATKQLQDVGIVTGSQSQQRERQIATDRLSEIERSLTPTSMRIIEPVKSKEPRSDIRVTQDVFRDVVSTPVTIVTTKPDIITDLTKRTPPPTPIIPGIPLFPSGGGIGSGGIKRQCPNIHFNPRILSDFFLKNRSFPKLPYILINCPLSFVV